MLKIVRTELNKALANMPEMFPETKRVCQEYRTAAGKLDQKEEQLKQLLADLQEDHAKNLLSQQNTTDISEVIYLQKQAKELLNEAKIIESLSEDLDGEKVQLQLENARIIQGVYARELSAAKALFDVGQTVDQIKYELVKAITDYGKELREQHTSMVHLVEDLLQSVEVQEGSKGFQRTFDYDNGSLAYWKANKTVLHREDIRLACGGNMPPEIRLAVKEGN